MKHLLYENKKIITILFIYFDCALDFNMWNRLSVETLAGDVKGYWGNEIDYEIIGINEENDFYNQIIHKIKTEKFDIIGLSIGLNSLSIYNQFMTEFYKNVHYKPIVICGNILPTFSPEYFYEKEYFKNNMILALGEGELIFRDIVKYRKGQIDLKLISNIIYWDQITQTIYITEKVPINTDKLIYPPSVDTITPRKVNILQTSRGCSFNCLYCSQGPGNHWRPLPTQRVYDNMENLIEHGVTEFEFVDDEFFGGRTQKHLERVSNFISQLKTLRHLKRIEITFRIFTNPSIIYSEKVDPSEQDINQEIFLLLKQLKENGLKKIYLGVESGSIAQRKRFNRHESIVEVLKSIEIIKSLGIDLDIGYILFDPMLTFEELEQSLEFFIKNDFIEYNTWPFRPLTITRNTPIYKLAEKNGLIKGEIDYNTNSFQYDFSDIRIKNIACITNCLAKITSKVFYAVKYITKQYYNSNKIEYEIVDKTKKISIMNAKIYLELLSELVYCGKYNKSYYFPILNQIKKINLLLHSVQENNINISPSILTRGINQNQEFIEWFQFLREKENNILIKCIIEYIKNNPKLFF